MLLRKPVNNRFVAIVAIAIISIILCIIAYKIWLAPTKVLFVNVQPAMCAEIKYANQGWGIKPVFKSTDELKDFSGYDAVILIGRGLHLEPQQIDDLDKIIEKGIPVYTYAVKNYTLDINANISVEAQRQIKSYLANPSQANYANMLKYIKSVVKPHRFPKKAFEGPVIQPDNAYYHLASGHYFDNPDSLTTYLKDKNLYNPDGLNVALIAGFNFPPENNRPHVDSLISRLTTKGYNAYPLVANGANRAKRLMELDPDAIIYMPLGRLGNDSLIEWLNSHNTAIFSPFPLTQNHEEWLDIDNPISAGQLNARIILPEIDGAIDPLALATQQVGADSLYRVVLEPERLDRFVELFDRQVSLKTKSNKDKKIAIAYFRHPGKDALLASGMEVVPSLYALLKILKQNGYAVENLPDNIQEFSQMLNHYGSVLGDYANGAQEDFLNSPYPTFIPVEEYESWVGKALLPDKYKEVEDRYGKAPGRLLARNDSIAIAALQFGNILLFPQPRPALGSDHYKLVHGAQVAPPHSYIAPYLYMKYRFDPDAFIHFGTHGNLEFTPGKNVGLSKADWADALIGDTPHFYLYTTGNIGEGIIAKRRTHAALITYLTPPFVESGMQKQVGNVLEAVHRALNGNESDFEANSKNAKKLIIKKGYHRALNLDSISEKPYSKSELERVDELLEEMANEKITGAYYVLGSKYSDRDLLTTTIAICADEAAFMLAKEDYQKGRINKDQLNDFTFISHHYLENAKKRIRNAVESQETASLDTISILCLDVYNRLRASSDSEIKSILNALSGGAIAPASGGDPVLNPRALPTGRNMYSVNTEATPTEGAWEEGKALAKATIEEYQTIHGEYPRKTSYTFWAGEFISSEGATIAQALYMLGVEPVRDRKGNVLQLRLIPSSELGRPRIDIMVQVSGQLRDIAGSRLKLITQAVKLAAESEDDIFPNYVNQGVSAQRTSLIENGKTPVKAEELSYMRVFGPLNSGYGTGMMDYTENSGEWESEKELSAAYLNNMSAMYGDDDNWGMSEPDVLKTAIDRTDVIVQPRQSNTWGPLSLDHVYEFTGSLSLTATEITGKEPDAYMADYRNRSLPKLQEAKAAVAVEAYSTILNPEYIKHRMEGGATTASEFGEVFRNIFGWNVMRKSSIDPNLYNDLYDTYIDDCNNLGINEYFEKVNPAAFQEMTATMMESIRKGYWQASELQKQTVASQHAEMAKKHGAPCTEFVCGNKKLQDFIAQSLSPEEAKAYQQAIQKATAANGQQKDVVLKKTTFDFFPENPEVAKITWIGLGLGIIILLIILFFKRKKND